MKELNVTVRLKFLADEMSEVSFMIDQLANRRVDRFLIRDKLKELIDCCAVEADSPNFLVDVRDVEYDLDEREVDEDEETGAGEDTGDTE